MLPGTTAKIRSGISGATVTAGKSVYLDPTVNKYKLADANGAGYAPNGAGVAMNGASDGQPIDVAYGGKITAGGTVTIGTIYVVSATAGGIAPHGDLATGHQVSILGVGVSVTEIELLPEGPFTPTGAVVP